jgi:eukaryotic translation initiation factor 2C
MKNPIVKYENGHGNLKAQLLSAGKECAQKFGGLPNLIVVVLPNGAGEIRHAIKQ